jgi:hypothetical protein
MPSVQAFLFGVLATTSMSVTEEIELKGTEKQSQTGWTGMRAETGAAASAASATSANSESERNNMPIVEALVQLLQPPMQPERTGEMFESLAGLRVSQFSRLLW